MRNRIGALVIAAAIVLLGVIVVLQARRIRNDFHNLASDIATLTREVVDARADLRRMEIKSDRILDEVIERTAKETGRVIGEVKATTRELQKDIGRWAAADQVPTLRGLQPITVGGAIAKGLPFEIKPGVAVIDLIAGNGFAADWHWNRDGDLPVPWPAIYRDVHHQDFSPYAFLQNARQIAAVLKAGGPAAEEHRKVLPYLTRQLAAFTETDPGGLAFVVYRFDLDIYGTTIKSGWRSAFGNAAVVLGLLDLFEATGDETWIDQAGPYLAALLAVDRAGGVTRVDAAQYLWFEEYPEPVQHVINGHIATVLALYRYSQARQDDRLRPYIVAGLTTMRRYLPTVRRAGGVSSYGIFDLSQPDYSPQRMINFVRALAELTGDTEFATLAAAFETDMPLPAQ